MGVIATCTVMSVCTHVYVLVTTCLQWYIASITAWGPHAVNATGGMWYLVYHKNINPKKRGLIEFSCIVEERRKEWRKEDSFRRRIYHQNLKVAWNYDLDEVHTRIQQLYILQLHFSICFSTTRILSGKCNSCLPWRSYWHWPAELSTSSWLRCYF